MHLTAPASIFSQMSASPTPAAKKRPSRLLLFTLLLSFLCLSLQPSSAPAETAPEPPQSPSFTSQVAEIEQHWGIQVVSLRRTAAGHMLDFRYRVTDAQKAAPLFVRSTKPYLLHQATGRVLTVPNMAKIGPLRNSDQPKPDRTYWMFFGNPGLVKAGDKVSIVIGDFKVENIIVN